MAKSREELEALGLTEPDDGLSAEDRAKLEAGLREKVEGLQEKADAVERHLQRNPDSSEGPGRFNVGPDPEHPGYSEMHSHPAGVWIRFEDHQALLDQERARAADLLDMVARRGARAEKAEAQRDSLQARVEEEIARLLALGDKNKARCWIEEAGRLAALLTTTSDTEDRQEPRADGCICPFPDAPRYVCKDCPVHDPDGTYHRDTDQEGDADDGAALAVSDAVRLENEAGVDDGSGPRASDWPDALLWRYSPHAHLDGVLETGSPRIPGFEYRRYVPAREHSEETGS